jgi:hypothetical protein
VLELVADEILGERIQRGPVPLDEAFAIAEQIAGALGGRSTNSGNVPEFPSTL